MKLLLVSSALAAVFAAAPAYAQQAPAQKPTVESSTAGSVTVQGVEPSKVLGSIDNGKLVGDDKPADEHVTVTSQAPPPAAKATVAESSSVETTPTAVVETKIEVIAPVSGRPTLDPKNPIAPEVAAVVNSGKKYTTADIVLAQLEAVRNAPVVEPTTTITTTTTTPTAPASPPEPATPPG